MNADSLTDLTASIHRLRQDDKPFVLTTVIKVHGSASARVGSKAIFDKDGKNIFGWIGGGCAERFVGEQAIECLRERKGRVVLADLDDEIFGLGVACGGTMEIFIEPVLQIEELLIPFTPHLSQTAEQLASAYGLKIKFSETDCGIKAASDLFLEFIKALSLSRKTSGRSLREVKDLPVSFGAAKFSFDKIQKEKAVAILGQGRIVESLVKHFSLLNFSVRVISSAEQNQAVYQPGECVIIASHSSRDRFLVEQALAQNVSYVGMVGSRKRAFEIIDHLKLESGSYPELPLFIPAGLDMDAKNPNEMGLSIAAEVVQQMKGAGWNSI